jgi:hypothetical protein
MRRIFAKMVEFVGTEDAIAHHRDSLDQLVAIIVSSPVQYPGSDVGGGDSDGAWGDNGNGRNGDRLSDKRLTSHGDSGRQLRGVWHKNPTNRIFTLCASHQTKPKSQSNTCSSPERTAPPPRTRKMLCTKTKKMRSTQPTKENFCTTLALPEKKMTNVNSDDIAQGWQ